MVFAIVIAGMLGASSPDAAAFNDVGRPPLAPPAEHTSLPDDPAWTPQREAAEQGDPAAQFSLGGQYASGDGVAPNMTEAIRWWRRAAEQGHVPAELNLAVAYQTGIGVPKNQTAAVEWYRRAAEQGDPTGQLHLGEAYDDGDGVSSNASEAVRWWHKAADQGNSLAQNHLGQAYHEGAGVELDFAQALHWYHLAAERGDAQAQSNLGFMYQNARRRAIRQAAGGAGARSKTRARCSTGGRLSTATAYGRRRYRSLRGGTRGVPCADERQGKAAALKPFS